MPILGGIGSDTVKEAGKVVDDIQANLTQRLATLQALLAGHKIVITIEVQPKQP